MISDTAYGEIKKLKEDLEDGKKLSFEKQKLIVQALESCIDTADEIIEYESCHCELLNQSQTCSVCKLENNIVWCAKLLASEKEEKQVHSEQIFEVGDKVWCKSGGWGQVTSIDIGTISSICVMFYNGALRYYTFDGKLLTELERTLFFEEVVIPESALRKKRFPKLNVDDKILVSVSGREWFCRYFHSFREDGLAITFPEGRTSWSLDGLGSGILSVWDCWKLPDDEK